MTYLSLEMMWFVLATIGFTYLYLRYLPVQFASGRASRTMTFLVLGAVTAVLFYRLVLWLFA